MAWPERPPIDKDLILDSKNLPEGYRIDEKINGVRDQYGRVRKSDLKTNINPNNIRATPLISKLKKEFKNDDVIVKQLKRMITYDHDKHTYVNAEGKTLRVRYPAVTENTRLEAIKLVLAYMYGRPHTQVTIDQNVDIKIDAKMHQIAELVSRNRDKLKIVSKDVIMDAEVIEEDNYIDELYDDKGEFIDDDAESKDNRALVARNK